MKQFFVFWIMVCMFLFFSNSANALQAKVDRDLNIVVPSLELGDQLFEINLDLIGPEDDPSELTWSLMELYQREPVQQPATVDKDLGLHIPNFDLLGVNFAAKFSFNHDMDNLPEYTWGLNELFFEVAQSLKNLQGDTNVTEKDEVTLQQCLNSVAFTLYKALKDSQQLSGKEEDLFFSPYTIVQSLAMLYAGAQGQTKTQMKDVLQYSLPQDRLHQAFNSLNHELAKRGEGELGTSPFGLPYFQSGFRLNVANSFWAVNNPLQGGLRGDIFNPEYLDTLATYYGEGVRFLQLLGFTPQDKQNLSKQINSWIAYKTHNEIRQIITPEDISNEFSLLLTNAIFFNASWKLPFMRSFTDYKSFSTLDGRNVYVSTMNQENMFRHVATSEYDALEIMYAGEELSMLVILPHKGRFRKVESSFDKDAMQTILNAMEEKIVRVFMPKWTNSNAINISGALKYLGLTDLFTPGLPDLSGISTKIFSLSDLIHNAMVMVDELGTKAAASTEARNMIGLESPLFEMNRPFIYIIRDIPTNTILFMGRVINPK